MKLNKYGWGLREMLVLSGILVLFLLISIYFIYNMYRNINKNNSFYTNLETSLKEQGKIYINDYYDESLTNDKIIISREVLKVYNLDIDLKDEDNNSCSGYISAYKKDSDVNIDAYIKCPKYKTEGYQDWVEK